MYETGGIIRYLSISDKRIKYKDKTYRLGSYLHLACIASCTAVSGRWLRKRTVQLIAQHSSWARNKVCLKISTCQVFCLGMKQTLWVILPRTCPTFLCKPLALEYCFKSWCILFIVQTIFFLLLLNFLLPFAVPTFCYRMRNSVKQHRSSKTPMWL